jgi:hypothetical protein
MATGYPSEVVATSDGIKREPVDAALRHGRGEWVGLHSERPFGEWFASVATPKLVAKNGAVDPRNLARWPLLAVAGRGGRLVPADPRGQGDSLADPLLIAGSARACRRLGRLADRHGEPDMCRSRADLKMASVLRRRPATGG